MSFFLTCSLRQSTLKLITGRNNPWKHFVYFQRRYFYNCDTFHCKVLSAYYINYVTVTAMYYRLENGNCRIINVKYNPANLSSQQMHPICSIYGIKEFYCTFELHDASIIDKKKARGKNSKLFVKIETTYLKKYSWKKNIFFLI